MPLVACYSIFIKLVCLGLLLRLAWSDLQWRRLPNLLVLGVVLCYLLHVPAAPTGGLWGHLATGLLALLAGMALTAAGAIGAGDAKLAAAVLCWAGPVSCLPTLLVATQSGLLLALLGLLARRCLQNGKAGAFAGLLHCLTVVRGVPYGVALAAGGVFALRFSS